LIESFFFGPGAEVDALNQLLAKLDTPQPQIEIRAGIYEYQSDVSKGSAIKAVLNFFNADSSVSFGSSKLGGDTIKLKIPNIDVIFSFLDQDSRFKNVATPKLMAKDGELARFFAGQDERVTGAVVLDRSGNPVQSKETLQAGVTLEITPRIRADAVDVTLYEAVSTFISSSSNNSDLAVLKRDIRSRLNMKPGFVYVIGGLKSHKKTGDESRFFDYSVGKSFNVQESELILLMSIKTEDVFDGDVSFF
jgi:general secretion pathway protein D